MKNNFVFISALQNGKLHIRLQNKDLFLNQDNVVMTKSLSSVVTYLQIFLEFMQCTKMPGLYINTEGKEIVT